MNSLGDPTNIFGGSGLSFGGNPNMILGKECAGGSSSSTDTGIFFHGGSKSSLYSSSSDTQNGANGYGTATTRLDRNNGRFSGSSNANGGIASTPPRAPAIMDHNSLRLNTSGNALCNSTPMWSGTPPDKSTRRSLENQIFNNRPVVTQKEARFDIRSLDERFRAPAWSEPPPERAVIRMQAPNGCIYLLDKRHQIVGSDPKCDIVIPGLAKEHCGFVYHRSGEPYICFFEEGGLYSLDWSENLYEDTLSDHYEELCGLPQNIKLGDMQFRLSGNLVSIRKSMGSRKRSGGAGAVSVSQEEQEEGSKSDPGIFGHLEEAPSMGGAGFNGFYNSSTHVPYRKRQKMNESDMETSDFQMGNDLDEPSPTGRAHEERSCHDDITTANTNINSGLASTLSGINPDTTPTLGRVSDDGTPAMASCSSATPVLQGGISSNPAAGIVKSALKSGSKKRSRLSFSEQVDFAEDDDML